MVDGVHFRRGQLTPEEIGHRALAGGAVGSGRDGAPPGRGVPRARAAGGHRSTRSALALVAGRAASSRSSCGVTIAGGDVTRRTGPDRVVHGRRLGRGPRRAGRPRRGRPGDLVAVTGSLGGAGAGLALVEGRVAAAGSVRRPPPRSARATPGRSRGSTRAGAGGPGRDSDDRPLATASPPTPGTSGPAQRRPARAVACIAAARRRRSARSRERLGIDPRRARGDRRRGLRAVRVRTGRRAPRRPRRGSSADRIGAA